MKLPILLLIFSLKINPTSTRVIYWAQTLFKKLETNGGTDATLLYQKINYAQLRHGQELSKISLSRHKKQVEETRVKDLNIKTGRVFRGLVREMKDKGLM